MTMMIVMMVMVGHECERGMVGGTTEGEDKGKDTEG
jgi:hypothetical protein